jgi:hypothetical protein
MRQPTSELRPGLTFACEWLEDVLSEHPRICKALRLVLAKTPVLSVDGDRVQFESFYWDRYSASHQLHSKVELFEMAQGAYVNPAVEAVWGGWQAKALQVENACREADAVEFLEPVVGWSFYDVLELRWSIEHPVDSGRFPKAHSLTQSTLSQHAKLCAHKPSEVELEDMLARAKESVIIHALMRFQAVKDKKGRPPCEALVDYNKLLKLLYEMMGYPVPEYVLNGEPVPNASEVDWGGQMIPIKRRVLNNALEILSGLTRRPELSAHLSVDQITPVIEKITLALKEAEA